MEAMQIGELEIHLISDGVVRVDAGGPFGLVPRPLYARYFQSASDNTVPMVLTCMLVRSEGKVILIDTGLGTKLDDQGVAHWQLERDGDGLLDALASLKLSPEDVDIVINTHLHSDHCGGNTRREGSQIVATFPRAQYLLQRIEWANATHTDARTKGAYLPDNFAPLIAEGRMQLLHGDTQITPHIRCVVTPGHTRGHQSVVLRSGSWRGMFSGDMASYAVHMARTAWLAAYDVEPLENASTKERWQKWALDTEAWVFIEHDPWLPVIRLKPHNGKLEAYAVEEAQPLIAGLPKLPRPGE
jgi:glyoxylase-like metal-dependent hydrolase (beta-lactamase superfamily II)